MKCDEAGSNREAEAWAEEDGVRCTGFESHPDDRELGKICCHVPVRERDKLSICLNFVGPSTQIYVDVFVDGILRNCFPVKKKANQQPRFERSTKKPTVVNSMGYCSVSNNLFESACCVVPLIQELVAETEAEASEDIGVIELRVSVLRKAGESYKLLEPIKKNAFTSDRASSYDVRGVKNG